MVHIKNQNLFSLCLYTFKLHKNFDSETTRLVSVSILKQSKTQHWLLWQITQNHLSHQTPINLTPVNLYPRAPPVYMVSHLKLPLSDTSKSSWSLTQFADGTAFINIVVVSDRYAKPNSLVDELNLWPEMRELETATSYQVCQKHLNRS